MRSDLDSLMEARDLDALMVPAVDGGFSPALHYLANGAHITSGLVLKARGQAPVMIAGGMELEEAAHSGLTVIDMRALGFTELMQEYAGDRLGMQAALWGRALEHAGVDSGRIGVYGLGELAHYLALFARLGEMHGGRYTFTGEANGALLAEAAVTKDADEIARIRTVAQRTSEVVRLTRDFLSSHRAGPDDSVLKADDSPLTIGDVKRFVRAELMARDLEEQSMIFAQGRDAGFPHSRGRADMPLKQGQSIVFDLFPYEAGGGYYHDMTRTWSLGYASEDVREAHAQVMAAFKLALDSYQPGAPTYEMQLVVQDYFEERGHPTLRSDPGTLEGYVHSLGHGIGLNIHERPAMRHTNQGDVFQPHTVITIEPGLYYPERGFGVRVEDSLLIDADGQLHTLTDVPTDLIVPLRGS